MDTNGIKLGQVVRSRAGRDKDRYFVVVGSIEHYAYIADGKMRKTDRPKKKKVKHLARTGIILQDIAEKLENDRKVTNAELRKHLKNLNPESK